MILSTFTFFASPKIISRFSLLSVSFGIIGIRRILVSHQSFLKVSIIINLFFVGDAHGSRIVLRFSSMVVMLVAILTSVFLLISCIISLSLRRRSDFVVIIIGVGYLFITSKT